MRITQSQRDLLNSLVTDIIPDCQVYLFGSRVHDEMKGGDTDILVLSATKVLSREERNHIRKQYCKHFGDQKLDVVSYLIDQQDPFKAVALEEAVLI
jgi:predicted nucleotidyltransferase